MFKHTEFMRTFTLNNTPRFANISPMIREISRPGRVALSRGSCALRAFDLETRKIRKIINPRRWLSCGSSRPGATYWTNYSGEELLMKPRCPSCKSKLVYLRLSVDQFVCRSCGHVWEKMISFEQGLDKVTQVG